MKAAIYTPPFWLKSRHLQTIYPTLFRKVSTVTDQRERILTKDHDFIDLDWAKHTNASHHLTVLTHGLEGHAKAHYCQGMARALFNHGADILAWNFRGCSGEPNHSLTSYHSGATEELQFVLEHVFKTTRYESITLVGFSLGGNLTLKYVGELSEKIDSRIQNCVAISVPCDLASSAQQLERWSNKIYMRRFMRSLKQKVREKARRFPGEISTEGIDQMQTFAEFDEIYTGPIHGFRGAKDYWEKCSCRNFLNDIQIPTLLINAQDDPFLTPDCFPHETARNNPFFTLEAPKFGGHLGFVEFKNGGTYWSESRALRFLSNHQATEN